MSTTVINFITEPKLKAEAQKVAKQLGIPLSLALNNYLKQLVRTKTVVFNEDTPSQYFVDSIKQSEEDRKKGRVSPSFTDAKDAMNWLNDPHASYANGDKVHDKI